MKTALRAVHLDDKYDLAKDRVFLTGTQAVVRLMLMQKERDRRAGRPTTERCVAMCQLLQKIRVPDVEVFVEPVREHPGGLWELMLQTRGTLATGETLVAGTLISTTRPQAN